MRHGRTQPADPTRFLQALQTPTPDTHTDKDRRLNKQTTTHNSHTCFRRFWRSYRKRFRGSNPRIPKVKKRRVKTYGPQMASALGGVGLMPMPLLLLLLLLL